MIRTALPARLFLVIAAAGIVGAAQVPDVDNDEPDEKRQVKAPALHPADAKLTAQVKEKFDQVVFGNGGWLPGARREFELRLAKQVDEFERSCTLTASQKKKLLAAGNGDIKRFFERVDEARRGLPRAHRAVPLPALNAAQQAGVPIRKERDAILAGEGFFFKQAIRHTLTEEQLVRYRKDLEERRVFRHRAAVRWTVVMLARSLGLTDDQRRRFESLLLEETRPPQEVATADYQVVMYQAALIPEARIKPIFDELQWRILSDELALARNQERGLKEAGHLPLEMIGD